MPKSLFSFALLSVLATSAAAQSSVTVFGVVDTGFRMVKNGDGGALHSLTNDGLTNSRFGFRGEEDLGDGLKAGFWLESALGADSGSAGSAASTGTAGAGQVAKFFNRRSTVSLSGRFGEIRLGRDYTPSFWNLSLFHAYAGVGIGNLLNIMGSSGALNTTGALGSNAGTLVRADNAVSWLLPRDIGGLYGQLTVAASEKNNTVNGNNGYAGARLGWADGPFDIAAAYSRTQVPGQDDFRVWNVGGSYKLGSARLLAVLHQAAFRPTGQAERTIRLWALSATVAVGQGEFRAAYQQSDVAAGLAAPTPVGLRDKDDARQLAIGYIHHLSKRTALYADWGRISNRGLSSLAIPGGVTTDSNLGVLPDRNSTALGLGLRHSF